MIRHGEFFVRVRSLMSSEGDKAKVDSSLTPLSIDEAANVAGGWGGYDDDDDDIPTYIEVPGGPGPDPFPPFSEAPPPYPDIIEV